MSFDEPVKNGCEGMYEMFHILNCGFEINRGIVLGKKERRERTEVSRGEIQEHQDKGGSQAL